MSPLCVSCEQRFRQSQDRHRFGAHHGPMNDQPDPPNPPTQPLQPDPGHRVLPPDPTLQQGGGVAPPPKERFVDRLWSLRAVIAVALASVILGGLGGAALASAASDDGDVRGGPGQRFHRGGQMPPPGMQRWRNGQGHGHDKRAPGMMPPRSPAPTPTPAPTPAKPTPTR